FAYTAAFSPGGSFETLTGLPGTSVSGFWGSFAVLTLLTYPFVYLPAAARFRQLPSSLEESARMLGRGPASIVRHVIAPLAGPAVVAGGLLVFLYVASDFGAVALLRFDTVTVSVFSNRLIDSDLALAMALLLALVALAAVAAERAIAGRSRIDTRRESSPTRLPLGRWRVPALLFASTLVGFALVAPLAVLAYWALRGLANDTSRSGSIVSDPAELIGPTVSTSLVSVAAAVVAVVVVFPLAVHAARRAGAFSGAASAVVLSSFAIPGLVLALALVFWTLNSSLLVGVYQTIPLLVGAYVLHFAGLALGTTRVAAGSVPPSLIEASRSLGMGRAQRALRFELPLMLPGLLAGAGLVLLSTMKELPVTLLLAPPGFATLATKVWAAATEAFWADASLASLVLVAASGLLTWLLVVRRRSAFA
ncbi:MAG: ABC transporter permease, partial [Miltoncostaeaceae bacterium]